jgi:Ca2+/H+ antiporter
MYASKAYLCLSLIVLMLYSSILRMFLNLHAKNIAYQSRRCSVDIAVNEKKAEKNNLVLSAILFHYVRPRHYSQSQYSAISTGIMCFPQ